MDRPRMVPIAPKCPQCGLFHPPIPSGDVCPMKKSADGDEIDFGDFLYNLRKLLTEKIKEKNIKDYKKMFSTLMIEIMKQVETF
jgi:hypothetical protein